jgi:hypothetical protein
MDYWDFHVAGMQGTVAESSEHVRRMNDRPRVLLQEICAFLAGQRLDINIGAERNDLKSCLNAWQQLSGGNIDNGLHRLPYNTHA